MSHPPSPTDRPLWQWSACDLASAIARRDLSAVQAVDAAVRRMREVNPKLNAVVEDLGDAALQQAEAHDRQFAAKGPLGPLHGVPLTIKENVDQAGHATPNGVVAFKHIIAPADAPLVSNLRLAGAIVIGRTNTPEFSFRATTDNELHGRSFNPWNDWASSGGSSGGASSAVMAGFDAIAHGNDIGGSLRYPAAATGAATVKPGLGRVPAYNPSATAERRLLAQIMSVQGVIAREVRDVRLAMQSLIRYDAHDPWMVPMPFEGPALPGPIQVAFTRNTLDFARHPAIDQALDDARAALLDAGYQVVEVDAPVSQALARDALGCLFGEAKALMFDDVRKHGSPTINRIFDAYFEAYPPYEGKEQGFPLDPCGCSDEAGPHASVALCGRASIAASATTSPSAAVSASCCCVDSRSKLTGVALARAIHTAKGSLHGRCRAGRTRSSVPLSIVPFSSQTPKVSGISPGSATPAGST